MSNNFLQNLGQFHHNLQQDPWLLDPTRKIQPKLKIWKDAIKAAEELSEETLPFYWEQLLRTGWTIEASPCDCGGNWVWVKRYGQVHGCVCHHTPKESTFVEPTYHGKVSYTGSHDGYRCCNCGFDFGLNLDWGDSCPNCGRETRGIDHN